MGIFKKTVKKNSLSDFSDESIEEYFMNDNFTENDWNLFKSKIPLWQESYMERLVNEYTALLNENINPSDKF